MRTPPAPARVRTTCRGRVLGERPAGTPPPKGEVSWEASAARGQEAPPALADSKRSHATFRRLCSGYVHWRLLRGPGTSARHFGPCPVCTEPAELPPQYFTVLAQQLEIEREAILERKRVIEERKEKQEQQEIDKVCVRGCGPLCGRGCVSLHPHVCMGVSRLLGGGLRRCRARELCEEGDVRKAPTSCRRSMDVGTHSKHQTVDEWCPAGAVSAVTPRVGLEVALGSAHLKWCEEPNF